MAWFGSANSITKGTIAPTNNALAPAPLAPINLLGSTPPPDLNLAASSAATAALAAARKQRKKAAGGTTLLTAPATGVQQAVGQPKSLLGY